MKDIKGDLIMIPAHAFPLVKEGDRHYFGKPVGIGTITSDDIGPGRPYADFQEPDGEYTRYELPCNYRLFGILSSMVGSNTLLSVDGNYEIHNDIELVMSKGGGIQVIEVKS